MATEKENIDSAPSQGNGGTAEHILNTRRKSSAAHASIKDNNFGAVFENPLAGLSREQLFADVEAFCKRHDLMDHIEDFRKGALAAQMPDHVQDLNELSPEDKALLLREHTHKWHQPWQLYWLVVMCSMAAAVQGMDETVNNVRCSSDRVDDSLLIHVYRELKLCI